MSIESIIGIVSGSIAIIGAAISIFRFFQNKHKTMEELFKQLVYKGTTDAERKKTLKKLNKTPLIANRIKDDYINSFVLGNEVRN